jgi:hypothetical protein
VVTWKDEGKQEVRRTCDSYARGGRGPGELECAFERAKRASQKPATHELQSEVAVRYSDLAVRELSNYVLRLYRE